MFPYTRKYTESEYDIQKINLLYQLLPKCQNIFENICFLENVQQIDNSKELTFLFYNMYNLHNSYFVTLAYFLIFIFGIYIFVTSPQAKCWQNVPPQVWGAMFVFDKRPWNKSRLRTNVASPIFTCSCWFSCCFL